MASRLSLASLRFASERRAYLFDDESVIAQTQTFRVVSWLIPTTEQQRGGIMLQRTNAEVAYCYQRSEENRRMADQVDAKHRQTYLDLEARWLKLALSYEFSDRLNQYTAHMACALDRRDRG